MTIELQVGKPEAERPQEVKVLADLGYLIHATYHDVTATFLIYQAVGRVDDMGMPWVRPNTKKGDLVFKSKPQSAIQYTTDWLNEGDPFYGGVIRANGSSEWACDRTMPFTGPDDVMRFSITLGKCWQMASANVKLVHIPVEMSYRVEGPFDTRNQANTNRRRV